MRHSKHLEPRQLRGLCKAGDAFLPRHEEFPAFSELGCAEHADRVLDSVPSRDLKDLKLLLSVLSWLPMGALKAGFRLLERGSDPNAPFPATLRLLRIGLKGIVLSLYYSGLHGRAYRGKTPLALIGYQVGVYTADLPARRAGSEKTAAQPAVSRLAPDNPAA